MAVTLASAFVYPIFLNMVLKCIVWGLATFIFYSDKYYLPLSKDAHWFFTISAGLLIASAPVATGLYIFLGSQGFVYRVWLVSGFGVTFSAFFYLIALQPAVLTHYGWKDLTPGKENKNE